VIKGEGPRVGKTVTRGGKGRSRVLGTKPSLSQGRPLLKEKNKKGNGSYGRQTAAAKRTLLYANNVRRSRKTNRNLRWGLKGKKKERNSLERRWEKRETSAGRHKRSFLDEKQGE